MNNQENTSSKRFVYRLSFCFGYIGQDVCLIYIYAECKCIFISSIPNRSILMCATSTGTGSNDRNWIWIRDTYVSQPPVRSHAFTYYSAARRPTSIQVSYILPTLYYRDDAWLWQRTFEIWLVGALFCGVVQQQQFCNVYYYFINLKKKKRVKYLYMKSGASCVYNVKKTGSHK